MTKRWNTTNVASVTATLSGSLPAGSNAIGSVGVTSLPVAVPFTDASTSVGGTKAALAAHAFYYAFSITNTHASQILYLGDSNVTTTRYIRTILPGETAIMPGSGDTSAFQVIASGAATTYLLGGY